MGFGRRLVCVALCSAAGLAVAVYAANVTPGLGKSWPVASAASTDCDHDGDSPTGVEFLECSEAPPEPGKIFTPAEKAQAGESYDNFRKSYARYCGAGPSDPLTWVHLFAGALDPCNPDLRDLWLGHLNALIDDPPNPSVFMVALAVVPSANGKRVRCTYGPKTCRHGRTLALAYVQAFRQETAAAGALATTLDRLSATPAKPESRFGSKPGASPIDSRRTQVAAGRLYSGLLAAWSERLRTASTKFAHFLDGLGGKAKQAAAKMPRVLPSGSLWKTYHRMNVFEISQLFIVLTA